MYVQGGEPELAPFTTVGGSVPFPHPVHNYLKSIFIRILQIAKPLIVTQNLDDSTLKIDIIHM